MILQAKNIYKSFQKDKDNRLEILKNVSLEIEENKITVIVGASGAGKSTLLHVLSGLDSVDSGEILFQGIEITKMPDDKLAKFRNKHIGFVFQFHHLLPEFTALENVALAQMIAGKSKTKAFKEASGLLKLMGLENRKDHKPAELSGGEQQRVAVARALVNKPDIIFADEPTGNLDSKNSKILHRLFIQLKEELNVTFLVVTHNPDLVNIGDSILEMKDGQIVNYSNQ